METLNGSAFGQRLEELVEGDERSKSQIARDADVSVATLNRWMGRDDAPALKRSDTEENLEAIVATLGTSRDWLLKGEGQKFDQSATWLSDSRGESEEIVYPLVTVGGGPGRNANDTMTVDKKLMRSELGHVPSPDDGFWAQVEGSSMEPWIRDGQYVFAVRESEIVAPGRYIIWWGGHESNICCYLGKMSSTTVLLRKFGPEKEYRLYHKEGDIYEIDDGTTVRMEVRGRVVWPPDTPRSVLETVTDQLTKTLGQALNTND